LITDQNFADMVAFHMRPKGMSASKLPWPGPLVTFPTTQGDRYDLSLHKRKTSDDPENLPSGHTIVLGPNGSGKTVIAMLLAATAVAQGARIIAFDKDNAMEAPLRALGAQYTRVRVGEPTGMNPFQTETDEAGQSWLANWVTALLSYDELLTAEQKDEVTQACIANACLPPQLQNFDSLTDRFKAFDDGKNLYKRASEWSGNGRLSWMFGEGGTDPFAAGDRHLVFDISEVLDDELVRLAWISYVMRQIERRCAERIPTVFIIDEAWVIAGNEYGAKILTNGFTTLRKLNVVMMLMTQIPDHILSSAASKSILENTSTKLLFPSRMGDESDYRSIGLNDAELTALRAHDGDRVMLMKKENESVWLDVDIGALGPLLRILSGSNGKSFPNQNWRQNPNFWKEIT
jgi:type IV secretion system protein VirB4